MKIELKNTYEKIQNIFENIESFSSVELVEEYRQYWKPKKVKIILLAESHVFTNESDMGIELMNLDLLPDYPRRYSKFVYCLAYGERTLTKSVNHPRRDGSPQFWKIFYSCVYNIKNNECFKPIQSSTSSKERIENKIKILQKMKELGIWLIDTSIVALYDNGKKPTNISDIIQISWENYTKKVLQNANPEHVIVIGKGVAKSIEYSLKKTKLKYTVIAQPNAHLSSDEHLKNYRSYYKLCQSTKSYD